MLYDLGVGVPRVRSWGRKVSGLGAMFSSQLLAAASGYQIKMRLNV